MPTRKAHATWKGTLRDGTGSFSGESGAIEGNYSFGSRFEDKKGSNPEELLAAAEAACYSMALSAALEQNKTPATRIDADAACTIDKTDDGFKISRIRLNVKAVVPHIDETAFHKVAEETKKGCPVSKALLGNVELVLEAALVKEGKEGPQTEGGPQGGTFPNIRV